MFSKENEDDLFGNENTRILSKTQKIREEMVDDMTSSGMPQRAGDIRILSEVLDSMDRQALDVTKVRAKQKEEDNGNATVLMVTELLSRVQQGKPQVMTNREIALPDEYIPGDIVPGETDISPETLQLADFIEGEGDEFSN